MSTLSAQCDELRELATKYDELKSGATRVVRISLDTGPVLREAADTIDRLDAENAKLREELEFERCENGWAREFLNRMGQKCGTKDCPSLVAYVIKIESDNAKLRELCETFGMIANDAVCDYYERDEMLEQANADARELGVVL